MSCCLNDIWRAQRMTNQTILHQIHALFPFIPSVKPTRRVMGAMFDDVLSWTPESCDLINQFPEGDYNPNKPFWKLNDGISEAIDDFYPFIKQILGGNEDGMPVLCHRFALAQNGLLGRIKGGKPRLWSLPLNAAAQKRCGNQALSVQIDTASLYFFRTGVGILNISWNYGEVQDVSSILEGNYLLSHDRYGKEGKESNPNTIGPEILREIVQNLIGSNLAIHADRRILYSILQVPENCGQNLDILTTRLSHRQTTDYSPSEDQVQTTVWKPFSYLCHGASLEGGASVVHFEPKKSHFIQNFVTGTGPKIYLPLALASLHSHFWLLNRTQWLPSRSQGEGSLGEKEDLEELFEATVEYRRYFHYPIVSQISLHNRFHTLWQEALSIPERIRFQERTARDVAELLATRRSRWIGRISGAVGGFLLTHELLEALSTSGFFFAMPGLRVWLVEIANKNPALLRPMLDRVENWEIIIFLGSVFGGLIGLYIAKNFDTSFKKE